MRLYFPLLVLYYTLLCIPVAQSQHYNITEKSWDKQFSSGKWNYLGKVAVERARNSVISGVFALAYAPEGSILDVGCGEGILGDYLNQKQKQLYLGIDISAEAIKISKSKRSTLNFLQVDAKKFVPLSGKSYDVIVFNEMIYYLDHKETLKKYSSSQYLASGGIIVICVWHTEKLNFLKSSIFSDAREILTFVDMISISGMTGSREGKRPISFHVEAYKARSVE